MAAEPEEYQPSWAVARDHGPMTATYAIPRDTPGIKKMPDIYSAPPPDTITIEQVNVEARDLVEQVFHDWSHLRSFVASHEEAICKSWRKSSKRRQRLLKEAWPGIPQQHRPDFAIIGQEKSKDRGSVHKDVTDAVKFPHMNLEDLTDAKNLLLLLDSRCRYEPDVFADSDRYSLHLGIKSGYLERKLLHGYTMHLTGRKTKQMYGCTTSWTQDHDSFRLLAVGIGETPGDGLLILELQARLLCFLVTICRLILGDRLPTSVPQGLEPSTESLFVPANGAHARSSSLTSTALEAPYRVPEHFNFDHFRNLVNGKRSIAEDEFWMLREDPGYLLECLQETAGLQYQTLLCSDDQIRHAMQQQSFWEQVIAEIVRTTFRNVCLWGVIRDCVLRLEHLNAVHGHEISPEKPLPDPYRREYAHLFSLLDVVTEEAVNDFKLSVYGAPCFQQYHKRAAKLNKMGQIQVTDKYPNGDRFGSLVGLLDSHRAICGLPNILHELERLMQVDSREKTRWSPRMAKVVSDMVIYVELQRQVVLTVHGQLGSLYSSTALYKEIDDEMRPHWRLYEIARLDMNMSMFGLNRKRFAYSSDKRPTEKTIAQMRDAEQYQDLLWERVDKHCVRHMGKTVLQHFDRFVTNRELKRTPEWAPWKLQNVSNARSSEDTSSTLSDALLAIAKLEKKTEKTVDRSQVALNRTKPKTRGPQAREADLGSPEETGTSDSLAPSQPQITVSKRAMKAFASLFHVPTVDGAPGELPWNDFLHAMTSAGFSAQKLDGSAWIFEPTERALRRSIIFHEPHPESKIPPKIGRQIARRLDRAFGWTVDAFKRK